MGEAGLRSAGAQTDARENDNVKEGARGGTMGSPTVYPPEIAVITSTRERSSSGVVELRALAVDVHVDVRTQGRAGLAEAVAEPGPALVEPVERLVDGARRRRRAGAAARRRAAAASTAD